MHDIMNMKTIMCYFEPSAHNARVCVAHHTSARVGFLRLVVVTNYNQLDSNKTKSPSRPYAADTSVC